MKRSLLREVLDELERFKKRAEALDTLRTGAGPGQSAKEFDVLPAGAYAAAVKRASLDLMRLLAQLRRES